MGKRYLPGEIGGIEAFLSENEVSIQLLNFDHALVKVKRNNECSFIHPIPSQVQETESFQFFLKKPSIFSTFQEDAESWLNDLEFINGEAWIQVWFQKDKHDRWRELLKQQYEDYLKGISYPSTIVPIRKLQLKVAELSRSINISIPTISTFEERKNQNIYRFFIRGYVIGEKTERKDFISRLLTRLNRQSKENEWGVSCKIGVKKEQLDKWKTLKVPYDHWAHGCSGCLGGPYADVRVYRNVCERGHRTGGIQGRYFRVLEHSGLGCRVRILRFLSCGEIQKLGAQYDIGNSRSGLWPQYKACHITGDGVRA